MAKFLILISTLLVASTAAIEMKMPSFAYIGERVEMKCNIGYGMPLTFKSITWLKDGKEFYSYKTDSSSPISVTNMEGVTVNMKKSSMFGNNISLDPVNLSSSGLYTCKMQLDHPFFDVAETSATLKVVSAPSSAPPRTSYESYKYNY